VLRGPDTTHCARDRRGGVGADEGATLARFTGKVAVITGAGSGIGRATARLMAGDGAAVTVADIAGEAAERVVAEITDAGGTARAQVVDVSDVDAVERMIADTVADYGGLDILHNNAAALDQNALDQDIATMDLGSWDRIIAVNLTGVMLGCRFALPRMVERGGGAIVNTASAAAYYGAHTLAAYGVTKAGIVSLTRYVATAYGEKNIRCNAVAPGVVVDKAAQEAAGGPRGERLKSYTEDHVAGRLGYPEEIASAVAYLASDEAAFITGETLRVDGGFTVHSPSYAKDRAKREAAGS
jgi:NAD(P)-dependent dehydrogenase (short-subunit alcohol dehydrogenase family)